MIGPWGKRNPTFRDRNRDWLPWAWSWAVYIAAIVALIALFGGRLNLP